ncbi:MAG: ABC transporter permease [Planctomycetota bacterium]
MRFPWLLVVLNIVGHPLRALLTLASLTVAFFLLCVLTSVLGGLEAGIKASANDRLVVQSAVSLFVALPQSYGGKIKTVDGVEEVVRWQWFGGYYQDPGNFFAQFAVDHDRLFDVYPEIKIDEAAATAFAQKRTACLVGKELARRYGFKPGDRLPLIGTIFARLDGQAWDLDVVGIYESTGANVDQNTVFFRYDYLDEVREAGLCGGPEGVGVYVLALEEGAVPEGVAARVDALFQNGPQVVNTTTEAEFQRQFVSMLGNVPVFLGSIGGGVMFAILLAVLNTMLMSARERTHDFGILKALGFQSGVVFALLLFESIGLCLVGGVAGITLALITAPVLGAGLSSILPNYAIAQETQLMALGLSGLIGVVAGVLPGLRAMQLEVVDALRAEV